MGLFHVYTCVTLSIQGTFIILPSICNREVLKGNVFMIVCVSQDIEKSRTNKSTSTTSFDLSNSSVKLVLFGVQPQLSGAPDAASVSDPSSRVMAQYFLMATFSTVRCANH